MLTRSPPSLLTLTSRLQLGPVEERERPLFGHPELAGGAACLSQPGGEAQWNVEWRRLQEQAPAGPSPGQEAAGCRCVSWGAWQGPGIEDTWG